MHGVPFCALQDALLPGEDPDSDHADDADHWLRVYTELMQTKAAMLAALSRRLAETRSEAARKELGDTDAAMLQAEVERFQRRLDFWKQRRAALSKR